MVRYRLKQIIEAIRANPREDVPPGEKPHKMSIYRVQKDTGLAYSTVLRMASDRSVKIIYTHALEKVLACINTRRNQETPEYTFNDLLEIVSEAEARARRRRKNG